MKKRFIFSVSILSILFTACSSDELDIKTENPISDADHTVYVSMCIKGDTPETRGAIDDGSPIDGTDFEAGTSSENAVNNAYFVFYDNAGNVVGDLVSIDLNDPTIEVGEDGFTVEKSYKSVIPVSVRKGEADPTQVICYINPISPSSLQNPLSSIQTVSRTQVMTNVNNENYFAMSNSVYYENTDDVTNPTIAVKIPEDGLFTSEEAARNALDTEKAVDIYVERYATKLKFQAVDPTNYQTATRVYQENSTSSDVVPVTLKFTPQYWALNAEANTTYVIKSFLQESESGGILPDSYNFGLLNKVININAKKAGNNEWDYNSFTILPESDRWKWNNANYHRSYWGMSPAYFTQYYPEVSGDLNGYLNGEPNAIAPIDVNQKYISYNELKSGNFGFAASETNPQYFKETTVGARALLSANPAAAVASVIYVGQYSLEINGTAVPGNPGFYTYLPGRVTLDEGDEQTTVDRPYIFFDNQAGSTKSAIDGGESMLKRFFAQSTILYRKEIIDGKTVYTRLTIDDPTDVATLTAALKVSEISDKVKLEYNNDEGSVLKIQNNSRSLQFTSAEEASGIYIVTGGGYCEIVPDDVTPGKDQVTLTQANVALMRQVGLSYYYNTGHAYFNVPVKHTGWYRKGNTQKDADKINWNIVRVGDFGMVRNHSYSVDVQEIVGLAQGIGDDDTPIVPPSNTNDYFLSYSVRILKWAVVPTQKVKL